MTKKLLLAALVAGIFTANNGFAVQNENNNQTATATTAQNGTDEQITTEEENNETIFTPVNIAFAAITATFLAGGTYFCLKHWNIDLCGKVKNLFRKKQTPKVEKKIENKPKVENKPTQTPKVENKPTVVNQPNQATVENKNEVENQVPVENDFMQSIKNAFLYCWDKFSKLSSSASNTEAVNNCAD